MATEIEYALMAKESGLSDRHLLLRFGTAICLAFAWGVSMNAYAATSTFTWKEEVLLHDGKKIIVGRADTYDSSMNHEIGQGPPLAEHKTTFKIPGTNQEVIWKSDNHSMANPEHLNLLSLDFMDGVPHVATTPNRSFAYNRWGQPNPPYVCFKYVGKWERISLDEFPKQFAINMIVTSLKNERYKKKVVAENAEHGFVRAETVAEINRDPGKSKQYYSIIRTPFNYGQPRPEHKSPEAPNPITPSTTIDDAK